MNTHNKNLLLRIIALVIGFLIFSGGIIYLMAFLIYSPHCHGVCEERISLSANDYRKEYKNSYIPESTDWVDSFAHYDPRITLYVRFKMISIPEEAILLEQFSRMNFQPGLEYVNRGKDETFLPPPYSELWWDEETIKKSDCYSAASEDKKYWCYFFWVDRTNNYIYMYFSD